jgi:CheY-like chemotaxis protein
VLLVENVPHIRELVADALGQCGAHVTAVKSAVEGLALLKRERPDALVSGLFMPDRDGYWLIREVRNLPPDQGGTVPAAAFTGCTSFEDRLNALQAGFHLHIPKPADLRKLAEVVGLLCRLRAEAGAGACST